MLDLTFLADDSILLTSVMVIVFVFAFGSFLLAIGRDRVYRTFGNLAVRELHRDRLDKAFSKENRFAPLWRSYLESMQTVGLERSCTRDRASTHFDVQSVFSKAMPLRFVLALPATLVGIGILFTFVGLSVGLQSIEQPLGNEQIFPLIEGMKTAFWSSVVGMFFSIVFNFIEKPVMAQGEAFIKAFRAKLDAEFYISEFELATELFGYRDEHGNLVGPGYVLRDIKRDSSEQTKALKSFSSDLADGIKISSDSLSGLGDALSKVLEPTLENIDGGVNRAIENASNDFIKRVMEESAGNTIESLKQVGQTISSTSAALDGLPDLLRTLQDELQSGVLDTGTKLQEETEITLRAFQDQVSQLAGHMQSIMGQATDSTSQLIERN